MAWFLFTHCRVAENRRGLIREIFFYRTDHRHSSTTRSGAQRFDGPGLIFATSKRDANVFLSSGRKEERWRPPRFCRQPSEKLSARIATRSIIPSFSSGVWTGAKARRGGILVRAHIATREILGQCAFARISIFDTFNAHSTLVSLSLARSSLHGDRSIVTADLLFFFHDIGRFHWKHVNIHGARDAWSG